MSAEPSGVSDFDEWCTTLRGEQAWKLAIDGGPAALGLWKRFRRSHDETGLWPVLLRGDDLAVDQLTWRLDVLAEAAPGIPTAEDLTPAAELFVEWMGDPATDDYLNDVPRHLAKLIADEESIRTRLMARPDEDAFRVLAQERITMALVPAEGGWEVPALLAWAGAEGLDITGPHHQSVLGLWNESYGAELVSLGLESLELLVEDPPADGRGAFELAVQQYAYCPTLMDNLVPAIGALAATLMGRHWYFDWS